MKIKVILQICLAPILAMFLSACAKHNAGFIKQGYHDLSARFNSNFNAKKKYILSIKSLENTINDNYDKTLPLYTYGALKDTKLKASEFDIVIAKATASIQLHKISNFSDDNFLLLGKAFYMKGEYPKAIESLRYVTANYTEGVDARSDKKIKKQKSNKKYKAKQKKIAKKNVEKLKEGIDIRPKEKIFSHMPAKSESLIWLAKSFTANEQYTEAQAVLDYIAVDNTFIQNYDREKELAHANLLIQQNLIAEAIPHLSKAISLYKKNKKKARYRFVLAQLYEQVGNKSASKDLYELSKKGNINYDMIFNATLKGLKTSTNDKNRDKEDDKLIAKLIRDAKNENYLDQLYYERAVIAENNKDLDKAKEFLKLSIEKSVKNNVQKSKSLIKLADIYYNDENYITAQEYYAESLSFIQKDQEDYDLVSKKANVLTSLVNQLSTISKNDSLLQIAELPQQKIERLLYDQAIAQVENENTKKEASTKPIDKFATNDIKPVNTIFYFYNDKAKSQGIINFNNTWGTRKLEDDWRRANKSSGLEIAGDPKTEDEIFDEKVEQIYNRLLAEIPNSDSSKNAFKQELILAHYTSANIYKYDLENEGKAIYHFDQITSKYTPSSYDAECLYNLYLLNKESNKKESEKNKNMVLTKHPKSKYAQIIKDPKYSNELSKDQIKIDAFYEQTYLAYTEKDYRQVLINVSKSKSEFENNPLEAKFALLQAFTYSQQNKYDAFVKTLESIIKDYSSTIEKDKAEEMLAYLKGNPIDKKKGKNKTATDDKEQKSTNNVDIFNSQSEDDKIGLKVNFGKNEIINTDSFKKESETEDENQKPPLEQKK